MKSQNQKILLHLKKGKKITPLEALNKFGCLRLSGRIFDLKEDGHDIKMKMVVRNSKRVAQYWIEKK
jgi:hypothetical protein